MDYHFKNIQLIAAVSQNNAIGKNGRLPWLLPHDMAFFKHMTSHGVIIMGRKTFESIGKRTLPFRHTVVVSSSSFEEQAYLSHAYSLEHALEDFRYFGKVFVVGGQALYSEALALASTVWITRVPLEIEDATAFFPQLPAEFECEERFTLKSDGAKGYVLGPVEDTAIVRDSALPLAPTQPLLLEKFVVPSRLTHNLKTPVWEE